MRKAKFLLLVLLVPTFLAVSCKKDDPAPTPTYMEPSSASMTEVVAVPTGLEAKANTDPGASMAVTYMGLANFFSSFGSSFTVPEGAQVEGKKGGSTVYFWSYGGLSYWMTYTVLADKYTWKYEYEFPDHPRFTYIYAEEAINKKSGNWAIYDPDQPVNDIWTYDWNINSSGTFTANLDWSDGDSVSKFEVVSNTNGSGTFKYYVSSVLQALIVWNADGSGTYTFYGELDMYSGVWTSK